MDGNPVEQQDISPHAAERLAARGGARLGRGRYGKPDFECAIDDFRVYDAALSQDELLQVIDEASP